MGQKLAKLATPYTQVPSSAPNYTMTVQETTQIPLIATA